MKLLLDTPLLLWAAGSDIAAAEGIILLTADPIVALYPGPIRKV